MRWLKMLPVLSRQLVRYWGRKPVDIVSGLIRNDDHVIIDPFGGSGSIILEALRRGKKAVYADINPYAWLVTHVNIAGADTMEFDDAVNYVVKRAYEIENYIKRRVLPNDWLYYNNGASFIKRRNFDRVSQFFPRENIRRLLALLRAIDEVNASINTKMALYLAFASSLYKSSLMNRRGAGSWGVPSYWAPQSSNPLNAYDAFNRSVKRIRNFLRQSKFYTVCYTESCDADVRLLLENALHIKYRNDYTLITDPPFTDEIQYMELSFFYWAWLRVSALPRIMTNLIRRRITYRFTDELVVNRNRGINTSIYMDNFRKFLLRTRHVKRKILIFHEERTEFLNTIREVVRNTWGSFREEEFIVNNHRKVGPRGGNTYVLFIIE
jgi:hypothetical protein